MLLRQNPGFERKSRSVRGQRDEVLVLSDHSSTAIHLLPDDVAEHATFLVEEILLRTFQFLRNVDRQDRQRDQLRVRMLQRGSGCLAMILENQDVLESPVFLQIENAIAEGPQDILNSLR